MRKDSVSPVMIITTSSTGNTQLTGSKDLVGLQSTAGEILMAATEFEQLAERYAAWKHVGTARVNDPCPECAEGTVRVLWSGTACDRCSYTSCY